MIPVLQEVLLKPILLVEDEEKELGLASILRKTGFHYVSVYSTLNQSLDGEACSKSQLLQNLETRVGVVVFLSSDISSYHDINSFTHSRNIPFILVVLRENGYIEVKTDFGKSIQYTPVNCGVYTEAVRNVHVGAVGQADTSLIVTCDRTHGLDTGDEVVLGFSSRTQIISGVISDLAFSISSSQPCSQGDEVKLVRRVSWPVHSPQLSSIVKTFECPTSSLLNPEVLGFLSDQVLRVLVSPGWVKNPAQIRSCPINLNHLDGKKIFIYGWNPISREVVNQLKSAKLVNLVIAGEKGGEEEHYPGFIKFITTSSFPNLVEFDLVICCSGDFSTRRSIGDHCVSILKPLIMLAQDTFRGQLETFIPHQTVSYSCLLDPLEGETPHCILKSFPHRAEHAVNWAQEKLERILVRKLEARNIFIQEYRGREDELERALKSGEVPPGSRETQFYLNSCGSGATWSSCVAAARIKFQKYFNFKAQQLTTSFPQDAQLTDGGLFWSWPKLKPVPVIFDPDNQVHTEFVLLLAKGFAEILNVSVPADTNILSIISELSVASFVPKNKRIETDESVKKNDVSESSGVLTGSLSSLVKYISTATPSTGLQDKDILQQLLVCTTYLRCDMYNIPRPDSTEVHEICKLVEPCLSTTSLQLAAQTIHQTRNILEEEVAESVWWCGGERIVYTTPPPNQNIISPTLSTTIWDVWEVRGCPGFTLSQFINTMENEYKVKVSLMVQDTRIVYLPIMPNHKSRLDKPMDQLIKNPGNLDHVFLSLNAAVDQAEDDLTLPRVKYYLKV
ncbi:ubiquitin-like modifier-activating enzyme 6 [Eurytemora carolleeae]|uniref:ubiquitin-like modifier-activating enzyme 6 n=1 Tax=Eurytemora carolleeae TaxID=1294199 RepID=UPI000C77F0D7|nr:ubiquitin-like modifier-activating enzyme 6 [Eurytemora carolleeae]|eukprot:XP_023340651.1 ubiquitin-like modifier-activating enzyme 6 [Eurytemora affinis]